MSTEFGGQPRETRSVSLPEETWKKIDRLAAETPATGDDILKNSVELFEAVTVFDESARFVEKVNSDPETFTTVKYNILNEVLDQAKSVGKEIAIPPSHVISQAIRVYAGFYRGYTEGEQFYIKKQNSRRAERIEFPLFKRRGRQPKGK